MERKKSWKSDLLERSRNDPVFFIEQVLGSTLWSKQKEICYAIRDNERIAVPACFDDKTEILTENRGFQLFKDLVATDKVASLVNGHLEFVFPEAHYEYEYNGNLIGVATKQIDFLVTPNHRCLVKFGEQYRADRDWEILTAEQVYKARPRTHFYKEVNWIGVEDEWTEKHYELFGFWCADGSIETSGNAIWITQKNHKDLVRELMSVFGLPVKEYKKEKEGVIFAVRDKELADWFVKNFGVLKSTRRLPLWLKHATTKKLKAFIRGFFLADGSYIDDHDIKYAPSAAVSVYYKDLAEDVYEVALKSGYGASIRQSVKNYTERQYGGAREVTCWNITLLRNSVFSVAGRKHWYAQEYSGKVYCVQVPSGLIFVRRNGVVHISHNSFGVGKCMAYGEPMLLSDGSVVPVETLIDKCFSVLAWDEKTGEQVVADAFAKDNGIREVVRLTTASGRTLVRTLNHPLWSAYFGLRGKTSKIATQAQFRSIEHLTEGMLVAVPVGLNVTANTAMDPSFIKICGYLLGDGSTTVGLGFTQQEGVVLDEFEELIAEFGCKLSKVRNSKYDYHVIGAVHRENKLLEVFRQLGLVGYKAKEKRLPPFIWQADNESLALLLNRLFACDGWVSVPKGLRGHSTVAITLASEGMIRDIELAMTRLGIYGNVSYGKKRCGDKYFDSWTWQCYRGSEIEKFARIVGIFGKEEKLAAAIEYAAKADKNRQLKWPYLNIPEGYAWEKIKSIEYLGEYPTVGICVPKYHTYLTTFVEHNTYLAARLCLWWLFSFPQSKVVSTAPCFDKDTEILTDKGWKFFKDLDKTEKVASLVDSKLQMVHPMDWMVYSVEGEMVGYKGRDLDFLVTPQHKLYTNRHYETDFNLIRADEVYGKWDYRFNRHCDWDGVDDNLPEEAYELFGFWMADGSAFYNETRRAYGICISQSKHIAYVEDLLTKNGFKYSKESKKHYDNYLTPLGSPRLPAYNFVVYSKDAASWFIDNFGRLKINRRCPDWLRNAPTNKLKAFLRGFMLADGCEQKDSKRIRVVGNKGLADDLQEIGLKAGYVVNMRWQFCGRHPRAKIHDGWALNFLSSDVNSKEYPASNKKYWYKQQYEGNVYCVQVPSGVVLVRRNGIYHWSGNTQRQVKDLLWAELRTAYTKSNIKLGGELFQLMLRVTDDHFAVGFSTDSENIDKFSGYHAPHQLVVFDQAAGIDSQIWEAAEGLMTSENSRWLAISNTAISSSEMANICMPDRKTRFGKWHVIQIKATESPNVLAGKNLYPGLVAHDWVKRREEAWGKDDPLYRIFVEAEFIPDSEMVVIPFEYINKAFETAGEVGEYIEVGLDVARMGTDSSVWVARSGSKTLEVKRMTGNTTMQVVGETVEFKKYLEEKYALPVLSIKVDVIGLGAGVYDRLIELDLPAVAVNNAEVHTMIDKERYSNIRAEMAWAFRYRMEHFGVGLADLHTTDYEIKDYVRGDIQAIRYKITSQGKIQIAQKDEIRKILGRSPDYWDALVLSYESPGGGPPSIEFIPSDPNEKKDMSDEEWKILLGLTVPVDHESFYETFS